jgi:class 3 adenylate cyclase
MNFPEKINRNVLYVDDEEQNLITFRAALRKDFNIFTARSAQEAIELMRLQTIAVVLTDQRMPEVTGVQFLERILPEFPDAIRIIVTGYSDMEAIITAVNNGHIFQYISKPWKEQELKMMITNALNLYHVQHENHRLMLALNEKVKEQEKTLNLFQRYVPKEVVEKALSEEIPLFEGELRDVSVLFCDLRNFSEFSADLEPKDVVLFLNQYYWLMSACVKQHHGTVCQFIGDEVFAVFGAPLNFPENYSNAVFCALHMLEKMNTLNQWSEPRFKRPVSLGIGINSGMVVAGNMGSEDKLEYSVTGHIVNMGKRIESLTREKPNSILISASTFEMVKDLFEVIQWEPVKVKGNTDPLVLYQVLGRK